jgi:hypothetical protein
LLCFSGSSAFLPVVIGSRPRRKLHGQQPGAVKAEKLRAQKSGTYAPPRIFLPAILLPSASAERRALKAEKSRAERSGAGVTIAPHFAP